MSENRTATQKKAGFTLIEVLIAMVILLVGLLGIASMQIMAMKGNQHARESTQRTVTANSFMEWLVSLDFDHRNLRLSDDVDGHGVNIPDDGMVLPSHMYDDGDGDDTNNDAPPPKHLAPAPNDNAKGIETVEWIVDMANCVDVDGDADGDGEDCEAGEETSKNITVTVAWEGGGSVQLSNIKPKL